MSSSVPARFVRVRVGPHNVWAWLNLAEIAGVVEALVETAAGGTPPRILPKMGLMLTNGREFELHMIEDQDRVLDMLRRLEAR